MTLFIKAQKEADKVLMTTFFKNSKEAASEEIFS